VRDKPSRKAIAQSNSLAARHRLSIVSRVDAVMMFHFTGGDARPKVIVEPMISAAAGAGEVEVESGNL
jgi:hypothetical protein